jgi:hypothetical protein
MCTPFIILCAKNAADAAGVASPGTAISSRSKPQPELRPQQTATASTGEDTFEVGIFFIENGLSKCKPNEEYKEQRVDTCI